MTEWLLGIAIVVASDILLTHICMFKPQESSLSVLSNNQQSEPN